MGEFGKDLTSIVMALIGLAMIALVIRYGSRTATVISAGAGAVAKDITASMGGPIGGGGSYSSGYMGN